MNTGTRRLLLVLGMLAAELGFAEDLRLIDAARRENVAAMRSLLKQGVDVNTRQGDGATALHWAAYRNNTEAVDLLIAAGANVDAANDLRITPLALASANGNAAIVGALLRSGANPDAPSETGVTPLMEAARAGSTEAVNALLEHEAKVNATETDRHQSALMWAAAGRHPEVVRALIKKGADVHARTRTRTNRVMLDQGPPRVVKNSRDVAVDLDMGGSTPLIFAARSGDLESAKLLLEARASVDAPMSDGNSPLVLAAFAGHGDLARFLAERGANVNAARAGYSALHAAALRGDLATTKALLGRGANPNARLTRGSRVNRFGEQWALYNTMVGATPLFVAAAYLEVEIMQALLEAGADAKLGIQGGVTPLMVVSGIDVQRPNRPLTSDRESDRTPRPEQRALQAADLLIRMGADVHQASEAEDTAMHGAAVSGFVSVIQRLADGGAKVDVKNKAGHTPLSLASGSMAQRSPFGVNRSPERLREAADLLRKLGATH